MWFNPRACTLVEAAQNISAVSCDIPLIKTCYDDDEEVELNQEISLRDLITRVARRGTPPIIPAAAFRGALPDRKPDRHPGPPPCTLRHFPRCKYVDHISKLNRRAMLYLSSDIQKSTDFSLYRISPRKPAFLTYSSATPSPRLTSTTKGPVRVPSTRSRCQTSTPQTTLSSSIRETPELTISTAKNTTARPRGRQPTNPTTTTTPPSPPPHNRKSRSSVSSNSSPMASQRTTS